MGTKIYKDILFQHHQNSRKSFKCLLMGYYGSVVSWDTEQIFKKKIYIYSNSDMKRSPKHIKSKKKKQKPVQNIICNMTLFRKKILKLSSCMYVCV